MDDRDGAVCVVDHRGADRAEQHTCQRRPTTSPHHEDLGIVGQLQQCGYGRGSDCLDLNAQATDGVVGRLGGLVDQVPRLFFLRAHHF